MPSSDPVNLTTCDREPIHIPGSIQPHGCLISCDVDFSVVQRVSTNAGAMLGIEGELHGRRLQDLLGADVLHTLRNALATAQIASRPALIFGLGIGENGVFDVAVHQYKSNTIIELEPAPSENRPLEIVREMIGRIGDIDDVDRLVSQTSRIVAAILGYDRVMIYRFEHDGAGKVVSETRRGDLESFLGQYFPATDIPQQARALYLKNTIRIISDASGVRVPVTPELDASGEPLDLSFAHLRSVSPIHCEYLRNMGVSASMSISIIIDGQLWGLVACHHYAPRTLPMAQRVAMEIFGEFFSLHLQALKQKSRLSAAAGARKALDHVLLLSSGHEDVAALLKDSLRDFARLMPNDGIGVLIGGKWSAQGSVPPDDEIEELSVFLRRICEDRIWATHVLSQKFPDAERYSALVSGVMAVPISQTRSDFLLFFRKELTQTLNWAGNPDKTYETGPLGDRLTPRKSFAIWKETVSRQAQPWTDADREIAEIARVAIVEVVLRHNELMAGERQKSEVRQRMLNQELNHRVKNILAVIKSLVTSPQRDGQTLRDYVSTLQGRIEALSIAHDQVVRGEGGGMLGDLLAAELGPYRSAARTITVEGPHVWLDSRAFSVMALVFHELATNAAKYGALSTANGRLDVTWRFDGIPGCEILWQERDGPIVSVPLRSGFGSALIDRSVPFDLNGESTLDYAPEGVRARFVIPSKHVKATVRPAGGTGAGVPQPSLPASPLLDAANLKVLVVEDQMLIAIDLEAILSDEGLSNVVIANSVENALARIDAAEPEAAILDINLGTSTSFPIAWDLRRRGVPFLFATGYGEGAQIPSEFSDVPIVRKPYGRASIMKALSTLKLKKRKF